MPLALVDDICGIQKCGIRSLKLNASINSHIKLKKLKFHVPDQEGKTKCHKLHIGKKSEFCPELKVHGKRVEEVIDDTYLGDVISADGTNKKNLQKRILRGSGIISQIMNLLDTVCHGHNYIDTALLLRESMFLNSVLNNTEVWYNLKKSEVAVFEALDLTLLRRIMKAPTSTPKEAFYLELGLLPIGVLLKSKRIRYLFYLLHREKEEMLGQFFRL